MSLLEGARTRNVLVFSDRDDSIVALLQGMNIIVRKSQATTANCGGRRRLSSSIWW